MNREQRRKAEREEAKKRKSMFPVFCDVQPELAQTLNPGDKFTVAGLRKYKDGTYTLRCKPGNETVFTAQDDKQRTRPCK